MQQREKKETGEDAMKEEKLMKRKTDNDGKKCRTVRIFVKIDGSRTIVMDVAQNDKVSDRCTIRVMSRMRGGGRHKDKKSKAEKKQVTSEEPVSNKGPAILESEMERVIQSVEEVEREQKDAERKGQGKGDQRRERKKVKRRTKRG